MLFMTAIILAITNAYASNSKGFYPSGELRYIYKYENGQRNGATVELDKNGNRINEFTYIDGVLVKGVGFYSTGKLRFIYNYKNGKRDGVTLELDKNGKKINEFLYNDGTLQ